MKRPIIMKNNVFGEVRGYFSIKDISTGWLLDEYLFGTCRPAIFYTKEDAEKYIKAFKSNEAWYNKYIIETIDVSFFNRGAILVTFFN